MNELMKKLDLYIGEVKKQTDSNYKKFYAGMLKKFKIKSPSELSTAEKKKFFNAVDKGFKAKNETD